MASTIALTELSGSYALPGLYIELDPSQAGQVANEPAPWLILGQKLTTGAAVAETEYRIPSKAEAVRLLGEGSIAAQMCERYLQEDTASGRDLRVRAVSDAGGATQATGFVIIDGTAAATGEIAMMYGGRRVASAVTTADTGAEVAAAMLAALNLATDLPLTAAVVASVATMKMTHSATPATPGKALYVSPVTTGTQIASFNCDNVTLGATETITLSDADTINVADNAAAPVGVAVAYDETNDRLVAVHPAGVDLYVMSAAGLAIGVYAVSSIAAHTAVYFDDNAAPGTDRVLAVLAGAIDATAAVVTDYIATTARNGGTVCNDLDVRHSGLHGEAVPDGITLAVSAMAGGATDPSITSLIAALGDEPYDCIIHPWDTSTEMDALDVELFRRWSATVGLMGHTICGTAGTASVMEALGDTENDRYLTLFGAQAAPAPPWENAAAAAGAIRADLQTTVGYQGTTYTVPKNVTGKALRSVVPPRAGESLTNEEANALIIDGVAPLTVAGSNLRVALFTTNEQTDENAQPTTRYRHALHVFDDMAVHRALNSALSSFLSGKRVTTDDQTSAPNTVTLKEIERRVDTEAYAMKAVGLIENLPQFLANRLVTKPSANRVAVLFPEDRANPLDQIGVVHQPRIDY